MTKFLLKLRRAGFQVDLEGVSISSSGSLFENESICFWEIDELCCTNLLSVDLILLALALNVVFCDVRVRRNFLPSSLYRRRHSRIAPESL